MKKICSKYKEFPTAMQGLGYKEVVEYLEGYTTYEEMVEKIKQESRKYAKRQLTWFRKYEDITWLEGLGNMQENIQKIINKLEE